jgi:catechol 2,3-dioxygenase-like lactoylglutathione lyase family enzyme
MIDHVGFAVSDYERAKEFYGQALAPLGYALLMEVRGETNASGFPAVGYGADGTPDFWIGAEGTTGKPVPLHVAFAVKTRAAVDAFHAAALAAGGKDNGAPGLRPHYHPHYYAAFVLDPEGNNIEAVCHAAE